MKYLIIDDEQMSRKAIQKLCELVPDLEEVASLPSALEAIPLINETAIDLIFLDIHMPEFNGIDFLNSVTNLPQVIIVTSDPNFALSAFEYSVVDYLLKPIESSRFLKAINKAKKQGANEKTDPFSAGLESLFVKVDSRFEKIPSKSINWVEAKGDYVLIKTDKRSYVVYSTMKNLISKLPEKSFFKCHRSYIINLDKIIDVQESSVIIASKQIPVSRYNRAELLKKLNVV